MDIGFTSLFTLELLLRILAEACFAFSFCLADPRCTQSSYPVHNKGHIERRGAASETFTALVLRANQKLSSKISKGDMGY